MAIPKEFADHHEKLNQKRTKLQIDFVNGEKTNRRNSPDEFANQIFGGRQKRNTKMVLPAIPCPDFERESAREIQTEIEENKEKLTTRGRPRKRERN